MKHEPKHWRRDVRALTSGRYSITADAGWLYMILKESADAEGQVYLTKKDIRKRGLTRRGFYTGRQRLWEIRAIDFEEDQYGVRYQIHPPDRWGFRLDGKLRGSAKKGPLIVHSETVPGEEAGRAALAAAKVSAQEREEQARDRQAEDAAGHDDGHW